MNNFEECDYMRYLFYKKCSCAVCQKEAQAIKEMCEKKEKTKIKKLEE